MSLRSFPKIAGSMSFDRKLPDDSKGFTWDGTSVKNLAATMQKLSQNNLLTKFTRLLHS